jgi:glucose-6-phosphate-specific signal transduction histidine kinase
MTAATRARSVRDVDRRSRDTAIDLGLCAAIVAYALPPMMSPDVNTPDATLIGPLLLPVLLLPIAIRRRRPLAACLVLAAGCVISGIPTFDQFRLVVAVPVALLVLLSLSNRAEWGPAVAGLATVLVGLAFVGATDSVLEGVDGVVSMMAFSIPLCVAVWGAGRIARSRDRVAQRLTERSAQLRRQREATAALAIEIDRVRLAADLDVAVRSRLHEMITLASADAGDEGPGRVRFSRIETLGRESLDQMRALLGLLRSADSGSRAPPPTLEQLDALLAGARSGGRVVDLEIEGEPRPLTAGVELATYRTVQHALLTLAAEPEPRATVRLRYEPDRLELEVRGRQARGTVADAALMAARERVAALGGTFDAATPAPDRRVLRARLPTVAVGA